MSQWPRTLSEFLGTNVQSYTRKKKQNKKAHVSKMSTCNLNSFVGTVNVRTHTHSDSRAHVPYDSLRLLVHEGLQTAPQVKRLRGIHLGGGGG